MLKELLELLAKASGEDKAQLFSELAKDFDELPKNLEEKYLAKKNQKLSDKDKKIADLESQIKNYQTEDETRKSEELKTNIQTSISKYKVNETSKKDFSRAVKDALKNEANKEKDFNTVVQEVLKENKHYTQVINNENGKVTFVDPDDEGGKKTEIKSSADLLAAARAKKSNTN